ncbi:MAG TPA: GMP synthase (glutamine-hydrolyzing), partial [Clostridiaceae bacterium]|nr:GMP synthase (glutamine-hydrolyzing) [Clostridiaceae bacterium]
MDKEFVIVIDFGGQYNQLIVRRVREANIYCEIVPYSKDADEILKRKPDAIIFTGGPNSVNDENAPMVSEKILNAGIPILGICYGDQLIGKLLGGKIESPVVREYGKT